MKINQILNSRSEYESPLVKMLRKQNEEKERMLLENDYRVAREMLYRTDDKFFETLLGKKDFRDRSSMIHKNYCFQHQLKVASEAEQEHYDNAELLGDPKFLMSLEKLHKGVQEMTRKNMGKGKHGAMTDTFHSRASSIICHPNTKNFGYKNDSTADGH